MKYTEIPLLLLSGCLLFAVGCASVHSDDPAVRREALAAISTEEELLDCVLTATHDDVRLGALRKIQHPSALRIIILAQELPDHLRLAAIDQIDRDSFLKAVALDANLGTAFRRRALQRLEAYPYVLVSLLQEPDLDTEDKSLAVRILHRQKFDMYSIVSDLILPVEVRMLALHGMDDASSIAKTIRDSRQDISLRTEALNLLQDDALLETCFFALKNAPQLQELAFGRLTCENTMKHIAVDDSDASPLALRARAAGKINDQDFLVTLLCDGSIPQEVKREALTRITDKTAAQKILQNDPRPEEWIALHAVGLLDSDPLLTSVLNDPLLTTPVRSAAAARIQDNQTLETAFQTIPENTLQYAITEILIQRGFQLSDKSLQMLLLRLPDVRFATYAFDRLNLEKMPERWENQERLAWVLASSDSPERRKKIENILYFPTALTSLIMEKYNTNESLALWAIDRDPGNRVLLDAVLHSKRTTVQSRAVLRLMGDRYLRQAALSAPNLSLRLSAISRLSAKERKTLRSLAQGNNPVVRMAALNRLKSIGDSQIKALSAISRTLGDKERAEADRRIRLKAKQLVERRQQLADDVLRLRGNADITVYNLWRQESREKFSIVGMQFSFAGRVTSYQRVDENIPARVVMEVHGGEYMWTVTADFNSVPNIPVNIGDYMWVCGNLSPEDMLGIHLHNARIETMNY